MKREIHTHVHALTAGWGVCSAGTNDHWDPCLRALEKERKQMTASFDRGVWCYRLWEGVRLWRVDGVNRRDFCCL